MNTKWSPRKKMRTLKCKISYRQLHVASPIYNGVQAQKKPCSPLMQLRLGNLMKISWNRIDVNLSTLPAHWDGIGSQEKRRVVWCARMSLQRQTLGSRAIARSWLSCRKTGILTIVRFSREVGSSSLWIIEGKIVGDRYYQPQIVTVPWKNLKHCHYRGRVKLSYFSPQWSCI